MPKRKQKSLLKTKDASGQPLSKRKRWHSHGVARQVSRDQAVIEQEAHSFRYAREEAQIEQWLLWRQKDERDDYIRDYGVYERYTDALALHLSDLLARRVLLDITPADLRSRWVEQRPARGTMLNRESLEVRIESPWDASASLRTQVEKHTRSLTNISRINEVCASEDNLACALAIVYFAPLWIREASDFAGNTVRELIDHLFVAYPVPEILYRAWPSAAQHDQTTVKCRQWFLCFAQGGSLYKLGKLAQGWAVSKRFAHQFAHQTAAESIQRVALETELALMHISPPAAELLLGYEPYRIDVTAQWTAFDQRFLAHWRDTARWIDRHQEALDPGLVERLLSWSYRQVRVHGAEFSWARRTVAASLDHANTYFESQGLPYTRWEKLDLDWESEDGWSVVELADSTALTREGMALSHCVGGYAMLCQSGRAAIFSLRQQGRSLVTIQLDPRTGELRQALGMRNRACSEEEMGRIRAWLGTVVERLGLD